VDGPDRPSGRNAYPSGITPAGYASANEANGPVINTLRTLLAGPATVSSYSDNKKDGDRQGPERYADPYAAISPICEDFLAKVGITKTSAYSCLCRRRHKQIPARPIGIWRPRPS
jgi:hypothetical protein